MKMFLTPCRQKGITENAIQRAVASYLRQMEGITGAFTFSHPANEGKRTPVQGAMLKAAGLRPGEPDIVIYMRGNHTVFIELKNGSGVLSNSQRERHDVLRGLGYDVYVVKARSSAEAIMQVEAILNANGVHWSKHVINA